MKCAIVLSVVIVNLLAASEVVCKTTTTKPGYETEDVEPKRSPLTQMWQVKRKALVTAKGQNFTTSDDTKSAARISSRTFNDTHVISSNTACPTWSYQTANGSCECGDTLNGAIRCNISMHDLGICGFYCMTFSNYTGHTVAGGAGPCIYETHITESSEFYLGAIKQRTVLASVETH